MSEQAETREELAAYAHEAWCGWMRYLFGLCHGNEAGWTILPNWAVQRWQKQMETPYTDLSEKEKDSDRKEADRMLVIIRTELIAPLLGMLDYTTRYSQDADILARVNVCLTDYKAKQAVDDSTKKG